jgi:hypothetical protein
LCFFPTSSQSITLPFVAVYNSSCQDCHLITQSSQSSRTTHELPASVQPRILLPSSPVFTKFKSDTTSEQVELLLTCCISSLCERAEYVVQIQVTGRQPNARIRACTVPRFQSFAFRDNRIWETPFKTEFFALYHCLKCVTPSQLQHTYHTYTANATTP